MVTGSVGSWVGPPPSVGLGSGSLVVGCVGGSGSGVEPVPGLVMLFVAVGFGSADVPGFSAVAEASDALASAPGDAVASVLAVGEVPGETLPVAEGCGADSAGSGGVSTCPAGFSLGFSTGSHGASELPESSVATMTTA